MSTSAGPRVFGYLLADLSTMISANIPRRLRDIFEYGKTILFLYVLLSQSIKAERHLRARGLLRTAGEAWTWLCQVRTRSLRMASKADTFYSRESYFLPFVFPRVVERSNEKWRRRSLTLKASSSPKVPVSSGTCLCPRKEEHPSGYSTRWERWMLSSVTQIIVMGSCPALSIVSFHSCFHGERSCWNTTQS